MSQTVGAGENGTSDGALKSPFEEFSHASEVMVELNISKT